MNKTRKSLTVYLFCLTLSCLAACRGKEEYIKAYEYEVRIPLMKSVIDTVIKNNEYLRLDSTREVTTSFANKSLSTLFPPSYEMYITMKILLNATDYYHYTFRYRNIRRGLHTDSAATELVILEAWDTKGNGGKAGKGVSSLTPLRKKRITDLFEKKFISQLDKNLGLTHKDAE